MRSVDFLQVPHRRQFISKFTPRHVQDLVGNVALNNFHKVLHFVLIKLELSKLN